MYFCPHSFFQFLSSSKYFFSRGTPSTGFEAGGHPLWGRWPHASEASGQRPRPKWSGWPPATYVYFCSKWILVALPKCSCRRNGYLVKRCKRGTVFQITANSSADPLLVLGLYYTYNTVLILYNIYICFFYIVHLSFFLIFTIHFPRKSFFFFNISAPFISSPAVV